MTSPPKPLGVARILVIDDEAIIVRLARRILTDAGFSVTSASSAEEAEGKIAEADLVLCDDGLPGLRGHALLESLRARGVEVPFILMTGVPTVSGVVNAYEHGATSFVLKPFRPQELVNRVRVALEAAGASTDPSAENRLREQATRREKHDALDRALSGLTMVFQPIATLSSRTLLGFEALMRSAEPSLPHPGAVLDAAEALGRLHDVGRRVWELTAASFERAPGDALLFVNLHARDLENEGLFASTSPLAKFASRVVLEITERADFQLVPDGAARLARMRELGYRIAVDDLGAGYAGLTSLVELDPEMVKLDMGLVRDIDHEPRKQRVVNSLVRLCAELDRQVIAEGVEREGELAVLRDLGCDLVQGYLLARPGPPFPEVRWS